MWHLLPEIVGMSSIMRASRRRLAAHQAQLLVAQMDNVSRNIPFYREFFRRHRLTPRDFRGTEDLRRLPIVDKHTIRRDPALFFNETMSATACHSSHTSGSTGEPFRSYFDRRCWVRKKYLSKVRARFACGMRTREKVAIFAAEPPAALAVKNSKRRLSRVVLDTRYFSVFEEVPAVLGRLGAWRPENAYGPPGHFFHLAQVAQRQGMTTPYLRRLYTSSEFLGKPALQFIREVFHAEIYDVYGSTEFKEIAWECDRHRGYHINEDEVVCEIVQGSAPAPPDEVGDIVLTDLRNRAMPLIRYRIRDRGRLIGGACPCGRTFSRMEPVAGRASDYLELPRSGKLSPYLCTTSIESCAGLLQYQFVQRTATELLVRVILHESAGPGTLRAIERTLGDVTRGEMLITVEPVDNIAIEENGKFRVVKNDYTDRREHAAHRPA